MPGIIIQTRKLMLFLREEFPFRGQGRAREVGTRITRILQIIADFWKDPACLQDTPGLRVYFRIISFFSCQDEYVNIAL